MIYVIVGRSVTINELMEDGYEAVSVGSGAGLPRFLNIPGESLLGVCTIKRRIQKVILFLYPSFYYYLYLNQIMKILKNISDTA